MSDFQKIWAELCLEFQYYFPNNLLGVEFRDQIAVGGAVLELCGQLPTLEGGRLRPGKVDQRLPWRMIVMTRRRPRPFHGDLVWLLPEGRRQ